MSTGYPIIERLASVVELNEGGNNFALQMKVWPHTKKEAFVDSFNDMTPTEVVEMALNAIAVASFWASEEDFELAVHSWRANGIYRHVDVIGLLGRVPA